MDQKAPTAIHGPLGITYHPNEKTNVTAGCSQKQFTSHDLCDEKHERQVETGIQVLLAPVHSIALEKIRLCDIQKLVRPFQLRKACGFVGIPNEYLRHLSRRRLVKVKGKVVPVPN
jgi:hypothetical protein